MARSKPTRSISLTYAAYDQPNDTGTLYPCFIAPRYILHTLKNKNTLAGVYSEGKGVLVNETYGSDIPYPQLSDKCIIDTSSVKIKLTDALLYATDSIKISKKKEKTTNCLVFTNAVSGDNKDKALAGYDVRIGDIVKVGDKIASITDIRAVEVDANVSAKDLQENDIANLTVSGNFTSNTDIIYIMTISDVTLVDGSDSKIITADIATAAGDIEYGDRNAVKFESGKDENLGNKGIKINFSSSFEAEKGQVIIVRGTPKTFGDFKEVYVSRSDIEIGADGATASILTKNIVPADNLAISENYFTAKDGVVTLSNTMQYIIGDKVYPVASANVHIEFRELVTTDANMLVSASSTGFSEFVGEVSPDNPLGFMAHCGFLAKTDAFYIMATSGESYEDYVAAINSALKYENVFAPITFNQSPDIKTYLRGKLKEYNSPEVAQFRKLWFADNTKMRSTVYDRRTTDNVLLLATMNSEGVVNFLNGDIVAAGVRAGDYLVIPNYYNASTKTYTKEVCKITTIIDENELVVNSGSLKPFSTPTVISIVRDCTKQEYVEIVGAAASSENSAYINYVWADNPICTGYGKVDTVYLCATLAAMRSAMAPHAPLSEVSVPGWTVSNEYNLSEENLDYMNDKGVWIVHIDRYGETVTRHQLTTVQDTTIAEEDSAVSNACNIIRSLRSILYRYRGIANVTNDLTGKLKVDLITAFEQIKSRPYPFYIGSQLLGYKINKLGADPDNAARIIVDADLDVPEPLLDGNFKFNIV